MAARLLILGATGPTGRHLVTQALEAGHEVTALARTADALNLAHARLTRVSADVTTGRDALDDAVRGQDAVISALGRGLTLKSENLMQRSVPAILSSMERQGVKRLIFLSSLGVGESINDTPFLARFFMRLFLGDIYRDKVAGESLIRQSSLDWTLVQPPQLTNGTPRGTWRAGEHLSLGGLPRMARADVASFMLHERQNPAYVRKAVIIGY